MNLKKDLKRIILIVILLLLLLFIFSINNYYYKSYSATKLASGTTISSDREPRIVIRKNNKDNFIILLHDNAGININKTTVTFDGKKYNLSLIETTNKDSENTGVYNKDGKRIKDLSNASKYKGKRYDYGIKIKKSNLSNEYKIISVIAYDYGGNCYLKETVKVKKLDKANKSGEYYHTDRAPRDVVNISNGVLQTEALDYSGIKSLKILAYKTNEVLLNWSANKSSAGKSNKNGSTSNGYVKDNVLYPYKVTEALSYEKAKISENKYKVKVFAEDISGIKSEKTMIFTIKNNTGNSGASGSNNSGNKSTGNSNSGSNNSGNKSTGSSNSGSNNSGNKSTGSNNSGTNNSGTNSSGGSKSPDNNNSGNNNNSKKIKIQKIEFTKSTYEVEVGKQINIGLKVTPSDANDYSLVWGLLGEGARLTGSGKSVSIEGQTANKELKLTVKDLSYPAGKEPKAECNIKVKASNPYTFSLNKNSITTTTNGKEQKFDITIKGDEKYNNQKVTFLAKSSNDKVARLARGTEIINNEFTIITNDNYGSATITITAEINNGKTIATKTIKVTVNKGKIAAKSIQIQPSSNGTIKIKKGNTIQFKAIVEPSNTTEKVKWSIEGESGVYPLPDCVTVDNTGKVTAKKVLAAPCYVVATCGNVSDKQRVDVDLLGGIKSSDIPVSSIKLTKDTEIILNKGWVADIGATVLPENATNKKIKWSAYDVYNKNIITINQKGHIEAKKVGKATITATAQDGSGVSKSVSVQVIEPAKDIELHYYSNNNRINGNSFTINKNTTLYAKILPSDATIKTIDVSTGNKSILKADCSGGVIVLEAVNKGTTTLKIRTVNLLKTYTVTVDFGTTEKNNVDSKEQEKKDTSKENTKKMVTKITLDRTSLSIQKAKSYDRLKATVSPSDATEKGIVWSSSNKSVATVTNYGKVIAHNYGNTKIYATATDGSGKKAVCDVSVWSPVTSIKMSSTQITLKNGSSKTISAVAYPTYAKYRDISWSSSNPSVATVDSKGKVTAKKKGTATIRAKTKDGYSKTCKVTVTQPVQYITISKSGINIYKGKSYKLTAKVHPSNANSKNIKWKSSNTHYATVKNGKVTGKRVGNARIRAYVTDSTNGNKVHNAYCSVAIKPVKVKSITITSSVTLNIGQSRQLSYKVKPSNASNPKIRWKSSKSSYVSVNSNGKVTARKSGGGQITITAVSTDGTNKKAYCRVKVNAKTQSTKSGYNSSTKQRSRGSVSW